LGAGTPKSRDKIIVRIAFLCSGLEPGRDGVGDFARTLATACDATGHETRLAAVRDPFRAGAKPTDTPASSFEPRFSDIFQYPQESQALKAWLHDFQPDWVSVHFTPFGFHRRGLGGPRAAHLRSLLPPQARRHIMLHEIWLQPGPEGFWRHRALGWWQRHSVDAWTGPGWKPKMVHTQARLHVARLRKRGVSAQLLPLCSTFTDPSITQSSARSVVTQWLREANQSAEESSYWIGHFGSFHAHGWDFPAFAAKIAAHPGLAGKRVCFLGLGRAAAAVAAFAIAARAVPQADFRILGELSAEMVPVAMRACDAAFTSTPWDIIEKSSAVAAWRALETPVLVARAGTVHKEKLPPWPDDGLILVADVEIPLPSPSSVVPPPAFLNPLHTAQTFLTALSSVTQGSST
jgi:hypothetical protein